MELTFQLASPEEAVMLFGLGDRNLKLLREALPVQLTARGGVLRLTGEPELVEEAGRLLQDMITMIQGGLNIPPDHLEQELERLAQAATVSRNVNEGALAGAATESSGGPSDSSAAIEDHQSSNVREARVGRLSPSELEALKSIARSKGQLEYIRSILENDMVACTGPAGTGKTFLAVRMAVNLLRDGQVRKLILCRPAVEAGEKLGFLPGDYHAKINPYLRPLYDALNEILNYDQVKRYIEREIIEIIPLAYMRGRTLNSSFIILDEGQNTTASQMKMFLTRMGMQSKIVVNGDTSQVDLPDGQVSGLAHIERVLRGVRGVGWVKLGGQDIVRHPLVKRIVDAYDKAESKSSR